MWKALSTLLCFAILKVRFCTVSAHPLHSVLRSTCGVFVPTGGPGASSMLCWYSWCHPQSTSLTVLCLFPEAQRG